METSGNVSDPYGNSSPRNAANDVGVGAGDGSSIPRRGLGFGMLQGISAVNLLRSTLPLALEYSGIVPARSAPPAARRDGDGGAAVSPPPLSPHSPDSPSQRASLEPCAAGASGDGDSAEVSIRIIGGGGGGVGADGGLLRMPALLDDQPGSARSESAAAGEREPLVPFSPTAARPGVSRLESFGSSGGGGGESEDSSYQSYDIQQIARWIEQILPFSILLLVVFIRQHLIAVDFLPLEIPFWRTLGFFVTIWISAVMYKSNDIIRRQTALKGERKSHILVGIFIAFMLHVVGIYWCFRNDDVLYPLVMLPPKAVPPFWHAIFIILVNDTLMRQAAMALKCLVLIYYKNGRGYNFRRQGQILTLIEYMLLLYRVMLPTPVWYRFFLNKENGSLFSSLTTGLYLTFKLTSVVEKVQFFLSAAKALSRREVLYGSHATPEQVIAAGDLCAICQEKIHSPILLRCKHIFCEDCVSEWFERERTCPLCRALVKPPDLRTFGDGSTNLLFQLF